MLRIARHSKRLGDVLAGSIVRDQRPSSRALAQWPVFLLALATAACAIREELPMRNPTTAQQLSCYSPYTYIMIGWVPHQIALRCVQACQRHGFDYVGEEPLVEGLSDDPPITDEMTRPYIPPSCLP
jgi:hypothetical protein